MKKIILFSLLVFLVFIMVFNFLSCKDKNSNENYTVKGHIYRVTDTTPMKNQDLQFQLYRDDYFRGKSWEKTLGTSKTDANGYFEFTYPYQDKGKWFGFNGQFIDNDIFPINSNIDRDFYNSFYGLLKIWVNTNNKLNVSDTFYYMYNSDSLNKVINYFIGNKNEFLKTVRVPHTYVGVEFSKGRNGLHYDEHTKVYYGISEGSTGTQIKGDPFVDSVYINY